MATPPVPATTSAPADRQYLIERVGEAAVVQVYADGFRDLPLREKTLVWHLARAAIAGRDIFYDQRYAHNLEMRDVLEAIVTHPSGVADATLDEIERYTKLFWINTGPYNNITARKFVLTCTPAAFTAAAHADAAEIMRWLSGFSAAPQMTYLVHGDPVALTALSGKISAERQWPVHIPAHLERVALPA